MRRSFLVDSNRPQQAKAIRTKRALARPNDPTENYARLKHLLAEMERLRPYEKPRGRIYRFATWEDHNEFVLTRAARRL